MRLIAAIILFLTSYSVSADAFDDDLRNLFELTGVKNNYASLNNVIINQMQSSFFQAADQKIDITKLSDEQKKQVGELLRKRFGEMVNGYTEFLAEKMPYKKVESEIYIPLYKETYSHDEIKELIEFYSSPVGKKTIEFSQQIPEQAAKKSAEKYDEIISEYVKSAISKNISLVKDDMAGKGIP